MILAFTVLIAAASTIAYLVGRERGRREGRLEPWPNVVYVPGKHTFVYNGPESDARWNDTGEAVAWDYDA